MKKYVKPELYYEDFELSQHIAMCDLKLSSSDPANCSITEDRVTNGGLVGGFLDITKACKFPYEDYCYTNGSGAMGTTFQS